MSDCRSIEMQDRLPDFASGTLPAAERSRVAAHLATCAACADDLALLRAVRALRPSAPVVDEAAIVRRLVQSPVVGMAPRATDGALPGRMPDAAPVPRLRVVVGGATAPSMRAGTRRRLSSWRIAAAIGVLAVGGMSAVIARSGGLGLREAAEGGVAALRDTGSATVVALAPAVGDSQGASAGGATLPHPGAAVSYGDLGDYSAEELALMLERLERWDGAAAEDPLPGVPLLPTSTTAPGGGELE